MTLQRTNLQKVKRFLGNNTVTILFLVICAFGIPLSGYSANYLVSEVVVRIARNSFLIVSLLIPTSPVWPELPYDPRSHGWADRPDIHQ